MLTLQSSTSLAEGLESIVGKDIADACPLLILEVPDECVAATADLPAPSDTELPLPLLHVAKAVGGDTVFLSQGDGYPAANKVIGLAVTRDVTPEIGHSVVLLDVLAVRASPARRAVARLGARVGAGHLLLPRRGMAKLGSAVSWGPRFGRAREAGEAGSRARGRIRGVAGGTAASRGLRARGRA